MFSNSVGSATSNNAATMTLAIAPAVGRAQPMSQYYNSGQSLTFMRSSQRHSCSHRAVAVLGECWELVGEPLGSHIDHAHRRTADQLREQLGASGRVHQLGRLGHQQQGPR